MRRLSPEESAYLTRLFPRAEEAQWCWSEMATASGDTWVCSRSFDHGGPHVAHGGAGEALYVLIPEGEDLNALLDGEWP